MANGVHGGGRTEYPEAQRLLWIISVLSRGRRVSARCIRDRFEVSAATAWRDLRLVEELGYALELASDGPPRQWQLPRGPGRRLQHWYSRGKIWKWRCWRSRALWRQAGRRAG